MRKLFLLTTVTLLVLAVPVVQAQDFSKVEITATKVNGNIFMLQGQGGNIGVSVGADGILIVDDQFAPLADKIKAALKTLGEGKLKFVLNTHWHGDHTGGNAQFGPEAPIIAHDNVRRRLATEQKSEFFKRTTPASPKEALPVITFDKSLSVHFNGEEIKVIHFPQGHTDGDSVIFFTTSNVVHMGDDFFVARFPFVDL
ncbi:MAG TPA: MBL fold metallo-hydrolase, partial [Pyrinomonadaceae bacterium]|nr:MBL fold metallo-hydrolase [Pyrinomonadaceae bacterium]